MKLRCITLSLLIMAFSGFSYADKIGVKSDLTGEFFSESKLNLEEKNLFQKTGNYLDIDRIETLDNQDSILNSHSRQLVMQTIMSRRGNTTDQVAPGTEYPGIIKQKLHGRVICNLKNEECKNVPLGSYSETYNSGRKKVNYSLHGFQSVGLIVIYKENGEKEVCNFILIDKGWAITAKHCLSDKNSGYHREWLLLSTDSINNTQSPLRLNGCNTSIDFSPVSCTYHIIKSSNSGKYETPSNDIDLALVKIDEASIPKDFNVDTIPLLDFTTDKLDVVTLIGNGLSNTEGYDSRRPQVGWFKGEINDEKLITFLEPSFNDTKPAPGDSGSPVYRGEYFGRLCEKDGSLDKCKPYLLSAIVSSGTGMIQDHQSASKARTRVLRLSQNKEFICGLHQFKGCN